MPSAERPGGPRPFLRRLRFRWNASAHYHTWLLSQIPSNASTALDVGCGDGRFTRRLGERGLDVDAVDRDGATIDAARGNPSTRVRWIHGDVLAAGTPLRERGYDVVVVIAALHFVPSRDALARLRTLVSPGGSLLIIGLYRGEGAYDAVTSLVVLPVHLLIGAYRSWRGDALMRYDSNVPVCPPGESLREIRIAAAAALPGVRLRRRAFWRYTLQWREQDSHRVRP